MKSVSQTLRLTAGHVITIFAADFALLRRRLRAVGLAMACFPAEIAASGELALDARIGTLGFVVPLLAAAVWLSAML